MIDHSIQCTRSGAGQVVRNTGYTTRFPLQHPLYKRIGRKKNLRTMVWTLWESFEIFPPRQTDRAASMIKNRNGLILEHHDVSMDVLPFSR